MELLQAIELLEEGLSTGAIPQACFGLCYNISYFWGEDTDMTELHHHFQTWKSFSGCIEFPVPGGVNAYMNGGLWEGEQLAYRLYLIDHIKKEITRLNK